MKNKEVFFGLVFCFLVFVLVHWMNTNNSSDDIVIMQETNDILEEEQGIEQIEKTPEEIILSLQQENNNKDIKALFRIPNTNYTSIVPQGKNNNYYLRRLANKEYSRLGSTYLDSRVDLKTSSKLLIYGHNSSKYDMPFKILENYYDKDFYNEHQYLELVTEDGIKTYQIFSVYVETNDYAYYQKIEFDNQEDWYRHILHLKGKSFYDTLVNITKDDKILILQTCSTHKDYKKYAKKYLLIISKEVNIDESN